MEEEKNYTVYCHENKTNGKKYFGITSRNPYRRFGDNGNGYKPRKNKETKFWKAINKYGWDKFYHIVLLENQTKSIAKEIEKFLIKKYNTYESGYNSTLGGETTWNKNMLDCYAPETIIKMKKSHIGKTLTDEQKEKIRDRTINMWNNRTKEEVAIISDKISSKLCGKNNPMAKSFVCENIIFETSKDLIGFYKLKRNIGRYISGYYPMPQKWKDRGLRYYNPLTDADLPIYQKPIDNE